MAGGWTRDGAVNEQIEASIADELKRMQAHRGPRGESQHRITCPVPLTVRGKHDRHFHKEPKIKTPPTTAASRPPTPARRSRHFPTRYP